MSRAGLRLAVLRLLGVGLLLLELLFLLTSSTTSTHATSEGAADHMTHSTAHGHSTCEIRVIFCPDNPGIFY